MIIVEPLREIVKNLNPILVDGVEYSPQFGWGTQYELHRFLQEEFKPSDNKYPLVWLVSQEDTDDSSVRMDLNKNVKRVDGIITGEFPIILAQLNNVERMRYEDREQETYNKFLLPLYSALKGTLTSNSTGLLLSDSAVQRTFYPNFTWEGRFNEKQENATHEIWDVLQIELKLTYKYCK